MKKLFLNIPLVAILLVGIACQNERSKDQASADDQREEKAENTQDIAEDANDDKFDDK